jgi:hypothetical protein
MSKRQIRLHIMLLTGDGDSESLGIGVKLFATLKRDTITVIAFFPRNQEGADMRV